MKKPRLRLFSALFPIIIAAALLPLSRCSGNHRAATSVKAAASPLRHATLLQLRTEEGCTVAEVADAWSPGRISRRYVLVPDTAPLPARLPEGTLVRTPLRRAVAFAAVHASLAEELGAAGNLCGICDADYVASPTLRRAIASGQLADMGAGHQPDVERIAARRADALLVSPFRNATYGGVERLGIPLIECADYMEPTPLGRAEWIRFFGLLFGRTATADSLFRAVETSYTRLAAQARKATTRPTLLIDRPTSGTWYTPGGKSYLARLYADAGLRYCFAHNADAGSVALSVETVFQRGRQADLWFVKHSAPRTLSRAEMRADNPFLARFRPFREGRVWVCNALLTPYFEEVPFHPERLLSDFVAIAHPELNPGHTPRYYHLMP